MEKKVYESIAHTADIQIRVYGESLEELFCNALKSMFLVIEPVSTDHGLITLEMVPAYLDRTHLITLSAPDRELLLIDFLSEALYLSDIHNEAYFDASFSTFNETTITATLYGLNIERFNVVEIKAVTYHDLKVEYHDNSWQAEVVFDI